MRSNEPLIQTDVEQEILRLSRLLESETEAYASLAEDAAKKEAKLRKERATQFVKNTTGTVKDREAWADYHTEMDDYKFKLAEALMKAKREKLVSLRTMIDALRTIAANIRSLT